MDLLAPCRSCLQCLPIFQISRPASPELIISAEPKVCASPDPAEKSSALHDAAQHHEEVPLPSCAEPSYSIGPQDGASKVCASPDPAENTQSSADTALHDAAQHLEEDPLPSFPIGETDDTPASQIIIAPAVSSPSSSTTSAASPEDVETNKTTTPFELPLHVPFINDISFSTSNLMPLPSPITPAPFGAGYAYSAGQYHPSPNVYLPQNHTSLDNTGHPHQGNDNSHFEHVNSHDGHEHSHHGHEHSHHEHGFSHDEHDDAHHSHSSSHDDHDGHDHSHHEHGFSHDEHDDAHHSHSGSHDEHDEHDGHDHFHHEHGFSHDEHDHAHHGHSGSHDGHDHSDETHTHVASSMLPTPSADISAENGIDVDDATNNTLPLASLETSNSTPECLDVETKHDGAYGTGDTSGNVSGELPLIETYHSEPIVVSGVPDDDDTYTPEEGLDHDASHLGRHRRRRDHFKDQFKGIRQQIKEGGHHVKEEGSKHLQTIINNMNKQAQQIDQSGSFFIVPRK